MSTGRSTALIVVDMQNAFVAPPSGSPIDGVMDVVDAVNAWVAHAAAHGWPIFYTQDIAPSELPDPDPDHQVDLYAGLDVRGTVVPKGPGKDGGFSGFLLASGSHPDRARPGSGGLGPLVEHLRDAKVSAVVVVGVAADVCVSATAIDARRLGYDVTVPLSATAFVHAHPDGDEAAIAELRAAGVTVTEKAMASEPGALSTSCESPS
jgi:nicotinamidase/pyrazinamidase